MARFLVTVGNFEWGIRKHEYTIEASNEATAAARAIRLFKKEKRAGRHRLREINANIIKV